MTRCFEPTEIPFALARPDDHPDRRHLETCVRCRSLALAYEEVLAEGVSPAEAAARLAEMVADPPVGMRAGRRLLWLTAVVAAIAALGLVWVGQTGRFEFHDSDPLHGALLGRDPATGLLAERGPEGLALSWAVDPRAVRAVVVFYDDHMVEMGRIASAGTRLVVMADDPLCSASACRLVRLSGADTVATSAIVLPTNGPLDGGR
jgi:hypothetical protein